MSTMSGRLRGHRFHGDPHRFEAVASFVAQRFLGKAKFIADVAGGQGMLTRILNKQYNFSSEVIDPRGWTLVGVPSRPVEYKADMAEFYDLIIGLHLDEALTDVVESAKKRPVILLPCCNFWSDEETLGRDALLEKIGEYYHKNNIRYEKVVFDFKGPKNIGLVSMPGIEPDILANKI